MDCFICGEGKERWRVCQACYEKEKENIKHEIEAEALNDMEVLRDEEEMSDK